MGLGHTAYAGLTDTSVSELDVSRDFKLANVVQHGILRFGQQLIPGWELCVTHLSPAYSLTQNCPAHLKTQE